MNAALPLLLVLGTLFPADNNVPPDGLHARPRAGLEGRYDDNIFLAPRNAQGAAILEARAGLGLLARGPRRTLGLSYDAAVLRYNRFPSLFDAVHHDASAGFAYDLARPGKIRLGHRALVTSDPATSELVARAKRRQNQTAADLWFLAGGRLFTAFHADFLTVDYRDAAFANLLDRAERSLGPDVGWLLSPRLRAFVGYRWKDIAYEAAAGADKDNVTHNVFVGAEGDFTARLTGGARAGLLMRDYDNDAPGRKNAETTPAAEAALLWRSPAGVRVDLGASRRFEESTFNRYYRANALWTRLEKKLFNRLLAEGAARYERDAFPDALSAAGTTEKRRDDLLQTGVSLTYQFPENYRMFLAYAHRRRASNIDVYDFQNNLVSVGIGVEFA